MSKTVVKPKVRAMKPALTQEALDSQNIALATDLVRERLINGTASSQETTHYLKLGSEKSRLEIEKLKRENELLRAKTEEIKAHKQMNDMIQEALMAFKSYGSSALCSDESDELEDEY